MSSHRILIADLNNFARYPTLSVGYLTAACRNAGHTVRVFSPLAVGVRGVTRERPATSLNLYSEKLNFRLAHSRSGILREARSWVGENLVSALSRNSRKVLTAFRKALSAESPEIVLISSYLMYRELVVSIADLCREAQVPVLLGGPYFAHPEIVRSWIDIPGVTALAAGEVELDLPEIVRCLVEGRDPTGFPGILVPDRGAGFRGMIARPLRDLAALPVPDFTDFPWSKYPERIAPVLTGRGCGWGACTFCSDVAGTAGRTFRSREPKDVLAEIQRQHEKLGIRLFVFTDMKLNSDLEMWHAILAKIQDVAPQAHWIASVHVGERGDTGLSLPELRAAAASGCVRLTTGLESGSQRILDRMCKGVRLEEVSAYLEAASEAGISTRATMISGYPGETVEDVHASTRFVDAHRDSIERIKLCSFTLTVGTALERRRRRTAATREDSNQGDARRRSPLARVVHAGATPSDTADRSFAYHRATARLVEAVHRINRRPLPSSAAAFEGVM